MVLQSFVYDSRYVPGKSYLNHRRDTIVSKQRSIQQGLCNRVHTKSSEIPENFFLNNCLQSRRRPHFGTVVRSVIIFFSRSMGKWRSRVSGQFWKAAVLAVFLRVGVRVPVIGLRPGFGLHSYLHPASKCFLLGVMQNNWYVEVRAIYINNIL